MNEDEVKQIKKYLAIQLERYILLFKKEYKSFIPIETYVFLNSITNYGDFIKIEDTGTITCIVRNRTIYLPKLAFEILNYLKKIPGFGVNKNHTTYNYDNLIINNNTFNTYIAHVFIAGLSPKDFFEEMFLHEVMHLCGMSGGNAFQEGLTEFKTREIARKYNLKTSACGYSKEVKIIDRLQEMFGEDLINKIAFDMGGETKTKIIYDELGPDGLKFFINIINLMDEEFQRNYYRYTSSFNGLTAPLKKSRMYNTIDYSRVYEVIDEYCNKYQGKMKK